MHICACIQTHAYCTRLTVEGERGEAETEGLLNKTKGAVALQTSWPKGRLAYRLVCFLINYFIYLSFFPVITLKFTEYYFRTHNVSKNSSFDMTFTLTEKDTPLPPCEKCFNSKVTVFCTLPYSMLWGETPPDLVSGAFVPSAPQYQCQAVGWGF